MNRILAIGVSWVYLWQGIGEREKGNLPNNKAATPECNDIGEMIFKARIFPLKPAKASVFESSCRVRFQDYREEDPKATALVMCSFAKP